MDPASIHCPGCGRAYEAERFAFGRTLHCACGARVGAPAPAPAPALELRFVADAMLGRLARWLRTIGYDTAFDAHIADAELARQALLEARVVLTRDRRFLDEWRVPRALLVESEATFEQLAQVVRSFGLDPFARLFTRCRGCNELLVALPRETAAAQLPARIAREQERFLTCPRCSRIYWAGSHTARMRRALERAFPA